MILRIILRLIVIVTLRLTPTLKATVNVILRISIKMCDLTKYLAGIAYNGNIYYLAKLLTNLKTL